MKQKKLVIETPEKIIFTYNIAEIGTRIAAYLLDIIFQMIILISLFLLSGLSLVSSDIYDSESGYYFLAVIYILLFIFQWGYFLFFETILNGRTPGKKICNIRVIRDNGGRLDFQSIVIRNLLRSADSLPLPFLNILGGLTAVISKQTKRLGDYVAGTAVVTDSLFMLDEPDFETHINSRENIFVLKPYCDRKLSEKDLYILRKFINEKDQMPEKSAEKTAEKIVEKLRKIYDISMISNKSDFEIIEEIYKAHIYENKK